MVIAASFNPILLDSSFIFCSEGLYLGFAAHVASQFEGETHSALTADARRAPVSEAAELQFDICAEGRFSNLRIHVHFMHDLRHQLMLL
jgi:hypothetical protein